MTKAVDMVIAIDGPAGGGKSTVARGVAKELGYNYLDSGAIYRAATLAAIQAGIDFSGDLDPREVHKAVNECTLRMHWDKNSPLVVTLNGEDVTDEIRKSYVTHQIRYIADLHEIRDLCTTLQRRIAAGKRIVCEGRDQGTVVFPNAFLKIYLWAAPEVRAQRRQQELRERGEDHDVEVVKTSIINRDRLDMGREVGALRKAVDAVEVDTTNMTAEESIAAVIEVAESRIELLD